MVIHMDVQICSEGFQQYLCVVQEDMVALPLRLAKFGTGSALILARNIGTGRYSATRWTELQAT